MKIIKSEEFENVLKENVVLVDFFANWCGPCKMLSPILEQVSEELSGKVEIVKVDVDECEDIARKFGIMSIPTMILFKNGIEVDKMVGLRQKQQIVSAIAAIL